MATASIKASFEWIEVEPDGQECIGCGDQCFLFPAKTIEITLHPGQKKLRMDQFVCESCFNLIEKQ